MTALPPPAAAWSPDGPERVRDRAAELLKQAMGTWSALGIAIGVISGYWSFAKDPGHLNLNLGLSLVAAVQGIVLQIAINRGDRKTDALARHVAALTEHIHATSERDLATDQAALAVQARIAAHFEIDVSDLLPEPEQEVPAA